MGLHAPRRAGIRDGSRYLWWSAGISWSPFPVRNWMFDAVRNDRNEHADRRHRQACCGAENRQGRRREHAASNEAAIGKVAPFGRVTSIGKDLGTMGSADDVAEGIKLCRGGARSDGECTKQRLEDKRIGCGKRNPRPHSLSALPQVPACLPESFPRRPIILAACGLSHKRHPPTSAGDRMRVPNNDLEQVRLLRTCSAQQ